MEKFKREYKYLSWQQVQEACFFIYTQMLKDGYVPDSIVALLRGGVVPGRIFSDFFDTILDFFALDVKLYEGIGNQRDEVQIKAFHGDVKNKKILILDDIWDSGKTMEVVLDSLDCEDVTTATLLWKETAKEKPNYYAEIVRDNEWVVFPWETCEFRRLTHKDK